MKTTRAQLKIQQMTFMLLAVTFLFVLVGLFFLTTSISGIKNEFTNIQKENAQKILISLASSPEFSCSSGKQNCIDLDKAMIMKDRQEYRRFWQVDKIEIRVLYPELEKEVECSKGNYPQCNLLKVYSNARKNDLIPEQSSFVSLCRKESLNGENYEKCNFGLLIVGFENDT
ncbi:MAG: hypothetical protein AABY22_00745 [Nanoarchaeota archaeon]